MMPQNQATLTQVCTYNHKLYTIVRVLHMYVHVITHAFE